MVRLFFTRLLLLFTILSIPVSAFVPAPLLSAPYFEDGYLGLTQAELRAKLGPPQMVRDRKAALRVFNYYTLHDWENYYKKVNSPQNGEDVYAFKRDGIDVRYSFGYVLDLNDTSDSPNLHVNLVDVEFSPPVPIERVPSLVPEFKPPTSPTAPAFRSNIWVLVFKGSPSSEARTIIREREKDGLDWTLAFQMFSLQGLPEFLTLQALIDRMEVSAQSIQMVKDRQRLTHEPIQNPFSQEFALRQPPPPKTKTIPVPKYAE